MNVHVCKEDSFDTLIRYVIQSEETNVGYAEFVPHGEGYDIAFGIEEKYRGQKYALHGIYEVLKEFLETVIYAHVGKDNPVALHVLTHNGFEITKETEIEWFLERRKQECVEDSMCIEEGRKCIVLAGGCFWGVEHVFQQLFGVEETSCGYVNGNLSQVNYASVCLEENSFREAVKIVFSPEKISLHNILDVFFQCIDPEQENGQREDIGEQYRTGVYYLSDKEEIVSLMEKEAMKYRSFHVVCEPLKNFYTAEEYHQQYLEKNPNGYCSVPLQANRYAMKLSQELKEAYQQKK